LLLELEAKLKMVLASQSSMAKSLKFNGEMEDMLVLKIYMVLFYMVLFYMVLYYMVLWYYMVLSFKII